MDINDVDDFNLVCDDLLCEFLDAFTPDSGLIREPNDEDLAEFGDDHVSFIYTGKGITLYERYQKRLVKLGEKLFPLDSHRLEIKASCIIYP